MGRWQLSRSRSVLLLAVALGGLAVFLRLRYFPGTLPYFISDGKFEAEAALRMIQTGDWNPHYFKCGGLWLNWLAGLYLLYFRGYSLLAGVDQPFPDWIRSISVESHHFAVFIIGKCSALLFGIVLIYLIFQVSDLLLGRKTAWVAAGFAAISPPLIFASRVMNVDVVSVCFLLLTVLFSIHIWKTGRLRDYLLAGIAAGLTIAAKYNLFACVPLVTAHMLRRVQEPGPFYARNGKVFLSLYSGATAFLLVSPYTLLAFGEFHRFISSFFQAHDFYAPRMTKEVAGKIFPNIIGQLFIMIPILSGPLYLAALGGIWGLRRERDVLLVLVSFPAVYLLFSGIFMKEISPQYSLPVLPFLLVLGSDFLVRGWSEFGKSGRACVGVLAGASLLFSASDLVFPYYQYPFTIHRELGGWVEEAVEPGEKEVLLTRKMFQPAHSFWAERARVLDSPTDFIESDIAGNRFEYIIVFLDHVGIAQEKIVHGRHWADFIDVDRYLELASRIERGEFSYHRVAGFGIPSWFGNVFSYVYPYHGSLMEYVVYRRSPEGYGD